MMTQQDLQYALAKQVPDIAGRGCTIGTSYGAIDIPPGRVADAIARAITRTLQCELLAATKRAAHARPSAKMSDADVGKAFYAFFG